MHWRGRGGEGGKEGGGFGWEAGGGGRLCHVLGESGHASLRGACLCVLEAEQSDGGGGGGPEVSSAPASCTVTSPRRARHHQGVSVGGWRAKGCEGVRLHAMGSCDSGGVFPGTVQGPSANPCVNNVIHKDGCTDRESRIAPHPSL